jgi:hypothetical protein
VLAYGVGVSAVDPEPMSNTLACIITAANFIFMDLEKDLKEAS